MADMTQQVVLAGSFLEILGIKAQKVNKTLSLVGEMLW